MREGQVLEPIKNTLIKKTLLDQSTRLIEINNTSTNLLDNLIDSDLVDKVIHRNDDVVDSQWVARHAKLIHLKGISFYEELAHRSRKYGRHPKALMANLISKALPHDTKTL